MLYGAKDTPAGIFTAARCHLKWVRDGDIVFEGQGDSAGCLTGKLGLSRAGRQLTGDLLKYEQVFNGPDNRTSVQRSRKITFMRRLEKIAVSVFITVLLSAKDSNIRHFFFFFFIPVWLNVHTLAATFPGVLRAPALLS